VSDFLGGIYLSVYFIRELINWKNKKPEAGQNPCHFYNPPNP
jgi:hypothetical protein